MSARFSMASVYISTPGLSLSRLPLTLSPARSWATSTAPAKHSTSRVATRTSSRCRYTNQSRSSPTASSNASSSALSRWTRARSSAATLRLRFGRMCVTAKRPSRASRSPVSAISFSWSVSRSQSPYSAPRVSLASIAAARLAAPCASSWASTSAFSSARLTMSGAGGRWAPAALRLATKRLFAFSLALLCESLIAAFGFFLAALAFALSACCVRMCSLAVRWFL
mmetsp:Transcript_10315/g.24709  ORF Transcript_10315/g.24709 Transcript_10315/m.24709 type:complete len:225 (+) Transcript_10315:3415-4089(+)